ncbi:hypothetical protein F3087_43775 [Nocardia colli]|uniref:Uncharacterized protein n=1 Tax=Nocardia colli TaxID=2545717 RepID=A0A5N0DTN9_9NOCA|nr:hypothetical protein [Nocardia colli]KAA8879680.1 hypothetical protein F3087_43775 [Nocardia colli]
MAATIGLLVSVVVLRTPACYVYECREGLVSFGFSAGLIVVGVSGTLVVTAVLIDRAARLGRPQFKWAKLAMAGVLVSSCSGGTLLAVDGPGKPSLFRESRDIQRALAQMPGVQRVSTESAANFSAIVVLTEEASAQQTAAVIEGFRDRIAAAPDFRRWRTDIEFRRLDDSFKAGNEGFATAAARAAEWHALIRAFPEAQVAWTYNWAYFADMFLGPGDLISEGTFGAGAISLKPLRTNDFDAIGAAYRRLIREFPDLGSAKWEIGYSAPARRLLQMNHRYPTEAELSAWQRLGEDHDPPRDVVMSSEFARPSSSPTVPGVTEQLRSEDFDDAKVLAEKHLPILAELRTPIAYLATTSSTDSLGSSGVRSLYNGNQPPYDRSVQITVSGCDRHTYYHRNPAEQALALRYENC